MLTSALFCVAVSSAPRSSRQCRHGGQHLDNGLLAYLHSSGGASTLGGNKLSALLWEVW